MNKEKLKDDLKLLVEYRDMHFNESNWPFIDDRDAFVDYTTSILDDIESIDSYADDKYIRLLADFDNYKKRIEKQNASISETVKSTFLAKLLPTLDGLERIASSLNANSSNPIESGTLLAYKNILAFLKSVGCEKIECNIGDEFDYNKHDAVTSMPAAGIRGGHICGIVSSGWQFNGQTLIPTKVAIASED